MGLMDRNPPFPITLSLLLVVAAHAVPAEPARPLPVTVRPAGELFVAIEASAPATTAVLQRTRIAARLAAPVEHFAVETGDRVSAGEVLVRLECTDAVDARDAARARLREAEAQAHLAGLQRERLQRLRAQDAVSAEELDRAEAEHAVRTAAVEARRAELTRARREVGRCDVPAPIAGVVTVRHQSVGDYVQPGSHLLTLVAQEHVELEAEITTTDTDSLSAATDFEFRAAGRVYPLDRPRRVGVLDPETRTEEFRFSFAGPAPMPGQSGRIHWRSTRTAIPADLPVRRGDQLGLFIADEGRARFYPLPDAVEGRPARTDLAPDTQVLIEGRHAASDGAPIEIVE